MTWMGVVDVATLQKGIIGGNYFPRYIHRDNSFTYNQGSEVCPLDAPDGEVFVMQSYNAHTDQGLAAEQSPATLSGKQTLPEGWRFRVKTLDRDLVVPRDKTGKPAHVMQGHLLNRYQAPTAAKRSATCHKGSARQPVGRCCHRCCQSRPSTAHRLDRSAVQVVRTGTSMVRAAAIPS